MLERILKANHISRNIALDAADRINMELGGCGHGDMIMFSQAHSAQLKFIFYY